MERYPPGGNLVYKKFPTVRLWTISNRAGFSVKSMVQLLKFIADRHLDTQVFAEANKKGFSEGYKKGKSRKNSNKLEQKKTTKKAVLKNGTVFFVREINYRSMPCIALPYKNAFNASGSPVL